MAFKFGFFNAKNLDRTYTAEDFTEYLSSIICDGILDTYGSNFSLTPASRGLSVTLGTGKAWLDGHYFVNDTRYSINLSQYMDESLPRYVGIAIVCDTSEDVRSVSLEITPGTPAETPSLPQYPKDTNKKRLLLYGVRMNPGRTSFTKDDWYDYRDDANACGYCRCILGKCKVTDMLSQIAQLQADISKYDEQVGELTSKIDILQTKVDDLTGEIVETGSLGENIYYVLYSNGKLLLRGTGDTYDYDSPLTENPTESPLNKNLAVKNIVISNGITSIGTFLFPHCDNLETISIPNTVTKIGRNALMGTNDGPVYPQLMTGLTELTLPNSVREIGRSAFVNTRIKNLIIPESVEKVGDYAFQYCANLETVRYEGSLIGAFMFVKCDNLKNVTLAKTVKTISSHWINYCPLLTSIIYEGSIADWEKITKHDNWDGKDGQFTGNLSIIQCLDGRMEFDSDTRKWTEVKA